MATRKTSSKKTKKQSTKRIQSVSSISRLNFINSSSKVTLASLKNWNLVLSVLLIGQAIAIVIIGKAVSLPVITHYLTPDTLASQAAGHSVLGQASHHLFDIRLAWLLAVTLAVASLYYLANATFKRKNYEKNMAASINPMRWVEYALGGGLVILALALLNGISGLAELLLILALVEVSALFSIIIENNSNIFKKHPWAVNKLAVVSLFAPWLVLAMYLFGAQIYGTALPAYIYWLDITTFAGFILFGLNMYLQGEAKKPWSNYLFAERNYLLISFAIKTAVVWQVFFGALR